MLEHNDIIYVSFARPVLLPLYCTVRYPRTHGRIPHQRILRDSHHHLLHFFQFRVRYDIIMLSCSLPSLAPKNETIAYRVCMSEFATCNGCLWSRSKQLASDRIMPGAHAAPTNLNFGRLSAYNHIYLLISDDAVVHIIDTHTPHSTAGRLKIAIFEEPSALLI